MSRAATRHRLGRTDVAISTLGMGTATLGNLFRSVTDEEAAATVAAAIDAGIGYFDTAPQYGHGLSERRIGAALGAGSGGVLQPATVLSTKVGRLLRPASDVEGGVFDIEADVLPVFDFSADAIRRSVAESLDRLGLDRFDIAYIHDPDEHIEQAIEQAYPVLHELRADGTVGAIGVGMNGAEIPTRFVRETDIDVVLLAGRYTLLDRTGAAELFAACADRGTSVVAAAVFNSGILTDPRPGATFDYSPASAELLARAVRIERVCSAHGVPLKAAALQFALGEPAVAGVLTGMRSPAEVQENVAMMNFDIPDQLWTDLVAEGLLEDQWQLPTSQQLAG